ncbi:hypothetical protein AK812_SmicGene1602 [Symbiodinium microadriaticum]|uniref:Uncharacterized protein n=1 Tax=Symbiodinium microadriaticum TaxID=2951 RepID=A0A1Q9F3L1_SYMMI|nr:hypothetical protein AK812_SmicGene1602 [Symbiodinium microadriaticum]
MESAMAQVLQLEEEKAPQTQAKSQPPKKPVENAVAAVIQGALFQVILTVEHDKNQELADMVAGKYCRESTHHKKDVFKRLVESDKDKEKDAAPTASMFLYFWDVEEEGGEEEDGGCGLSGVVGDEVLLQNRSTADFPPPDHWIVVATGDEDADLKASPSKAPPMRPAAQPPPDLGLEELSSEHAELKRWLSALDGHKGALLTYFDVLVSEFDGDLSILKNVKTEPPEGRNDYGTYG